MARPAPSLEFSITNDGSARLAWPAYASGYRLENTPGMATDAAWATVTAAPRTAGGWNSVVVPDAADAGFYRLRRP